MKLVFYTNFLNHHQVMVADELYKLLGNEFAFVATMPVDESLLKGGSDYSTKRDYCVRAYASDQHQSYAMQLAREAEVCVFGADAMPYEIVRATEGKGLSFEICERWLKKGWLNLASPRLLKWMLNYHRYFKKAGFYRLCASAFCKNDDSKLGAYKERSYKWGYFTSVPEEGSSSSCAPVGARASKLGAKGSSVVRLMWCARFLTWKHPEMAVELAALLKKDGYKFHVDIYGGEGLNVAHEKVYSRKSLEQLVERLDVADCVTFQGQKPNEDILQAMREHDIFLFTSDKTEGWGAVANEAMANGCCLVGSDAIGVVPYLVKDGVNGMQFKSCNVQDLYKKVRFLMDHPDNRKKMARKGQMDMRDVWSPRKAAEALLQLIDDLKNGKDTSILEGPCSEA